MSARSREEIRYYEDKNIHLFIPIFLRMGRLKRRAEKYESIGSKSPAVGIASSSGLINK